MADKFLDITGLERLWEKIKESVTLWLSSKQDKLVSGENIKTVNGESLLGSGDLEIGGSGTPTIDEVLASGAIATNKSLWMNGSTSSTNYKTHLSSQLFTMELNPGSPTRGASASMSVDGISLGDYTTEYSRGVALANGGFSASTTDKATQEQHYIRVSTDPNTAQASMVEMSGDLKSAFQTALEIGKPQDLTTPSTDNIVAALNSVQTEIDGLGEPFRVKSWGVNTLNVNIPCCTQDVANTAIPKMEFSISDEEGADYQVVGMIAYEVFDASGNRINCWPVCQFTGNGQKTLSVRWMCGGTTQKTAKRISAWVLLKHR